MTRLQNFARLAQLSVAVTVLALTAVSTARSADTTRTANALTYGYSIQPNQVGGDYTFPSNDQRTRHIMVSSANPPTVAAFYMFRVADTVIQTGGSTNKPGFVLQFISPRHTVLYGGDGRITMYNGYNHPVLGSVTVMW